MSEPKGSNVFSSGECTVEEIRRAFSEACRVLAEPGGEQLLLRIVEEVRAEEEADRLKDDERLSMRPGVEWEPRPGGKSVETGPDWETGR